MHAFTSSHRGAKVISSRRYSRAVVTKVPRLEDTRTRAAERLSEIGKVQMINDNNLYSHVLSRILTYSSPTIWRRASEFSSVWTTLHPFSFFRFLYFFHVEKIPSDFISLFDCYVRRKSPNRARFHQMNMHMRIPGVIRQAAKLWSAYYSVSSRE